MNKRVLCTLMLAVILIMASACSMDSEDDETRSIVIVKNEQIESYGSGFVVGYESGKPVIATACRNIAAANGAVMESARVKLCSSENDTAAYIIDYDVEKNIALMVLAESNDNIKPVQLLSGEPAAKNTAVTVYGYSGTGNLMSDFESFNTLDINRYNGTLTGLADYNGNSVYLYSNEFNRGAVGGLALDDGRIIGMCAYAFRDGDAEFDQYIIPSYEIVEMMSRADVEYLTAEEQAIKNIFFNVLAVELAVMQCAAAVYLFTVKRHTKLVERQLKLISKLVSKLKMPLRSIMKRRR